MDYVAKEDADIIALQEIKCDRSKLPDDIKLPGYHNYFLDSKMVKLLNNSAVHVCKSYIIIKSFHSS